MMLTPCPPLPPTTFRRCSVRSSTLAFVATGSALEVGRGEECPAFVADALKVRQSLDGPFAFDATMARLAEGDQVGHAVVAAIAERDDVMNVQRHTGLFRRLAAMLAYAISGPHFFLDRVPSRSITERSATPPCRAILAFRPCVVMLLIYEYPTIAGLCDAGLGKAERRSASTPTDNRDAFGLIGRLHLRSRFRRVLPAPHPVAPNPVVDRAASWAARLDGVGDGCRLCELRVTDRTGKTNGLPAVSGRKWFMIRTRHLIDLHNRSRGGDTAQGVSAPLGFSLPSIIPYLRGFRAFQCAMIGG